MKKDKFLIKFGERVKAVRQEKGFDSQMALALKAGLDRTYVGGVERGERNIALKNIKKLADALDIKLEDLFKF